MHGTLMDSIRIPLERTGHGWILSRFHMSAQKVYRFRQNFIRVHGIW